MLRARPGAIRSRQKLAPATRVIRPLPYRSTRRPATRVARISPAGAASRASPSRPSLSESRSLMAGILATQTAVVSPISRK